MAVTASSTGSSPAPTAEERAAWHVIYVEHAPAVHGFLVRRAGREAAEDLTADVFVRAFRARDRYEERGVPVRAYLLRIAYNLLVDRLRRDPAREQPVPDVADAPATHSTSASAEHLALARVEQAELLAAVRRLPEPAQVMLDLRFLQELSVDETAAVLGIGVDAVRARTYRALKALRQAYGEQGVSTGD